MDSEQQYSELALQFDAIIKTAIDGIIIIDSKGIIQLVNNAVIHLFGYAEEEMVGYNVSKLMSSPHNEAHDHYIENYLSTGVAKIIGVGREVSGRKKDGQIFPFRLAVSEVILPNKTIFAGIIHDLTEVTHAHENLKKINSELEQRIIERTYDLEKAVNKLLDINKNLNVEIQERHKIESKLKEKELELNQLLNKEKELNELKSRFVSMASHEFRTPLSSIMSSAALIQRYEDTNQQPNREKHIERIKTAVTDLTEILNDFLSFGQIEENRVEVKYEHFHFTDIIQEVFDSCNYLCKNNKNLEFINDASENMLYSDPRIIRNIMLNLVSNALKYAFNDTTIRVILNKGQDNASIKVINQGIGIPEEDKKFMFTRFFRASNASNIQGTGLGLNIVERYASIIQSEIEFESVENGETCFTLMIPNQEKIKI
ncbi:MAG: PAS domain-containing sensor histidine kinase [Lewinellaceae bacterium]|nr:PAS domain-containing sensor histidine kinase [Lewinellaceae bacterium]